MIHDIFFDCPNCSHTIKVSSDLVGVLVECPDCANEFKVPDIRDGLNPRLRSQQIPHFNHLVRKSELMDDLLGLERGLYTLMRRQSEQIKQIEFIEGNATLVLKQLRLLDVHPPQKKWEPASGEDAVAEPAEVPAGSIPWLRYSLICGWLTLVGVVVFGVLLLRAA
ncbi:hypothetical protein P0Y35_00995 [Kiritimatiellaeota bacterium B1221]|nr:hypothetical protein [Kiritimatiellaeota bacterium B1221]